MKNDLFCPLPWISTSVRNDGKLRICCHSNQGPNRGELNWDIDDVSGSRNSPKLKEVRRQILSNEWPEDCIRCKKESEAGIRTRFQYESDMWKNKITKTEAKRHTESDGSIDTNSFPLIYYDLRFGNQCNLQCRYCSPFSSSALGTAKGDLNWFKRDAFWNHIRSNIHNINYFHIEGGEPMLIKEHFDFMELCIDLNRAKDIRIEYTSSLSMIPEKAWDMWKEFKEVRIGTSIDATHEQFEYIRYPSKFDTVVKNLHKLDEAEGNFVLWIACTVSILNIWYIPEFFKWKIKQNFNRVNRKLIRPYCSDHPIHAPKHYNIKCLPMSVKSAVTDHLLHSLSSIDDTANKYEVEYQMRDEYKKSARNLIYSYIKYMIKEDFSAKAFPIFCAVTKRLDEERNQSMTKMMPEWAEVLRGER